MSSVAPLGFVVVVLRHVLFDTVEPFGDLVEGLQQKVADFVRQVRLRGQQVAQVDLRAAVGDQGACISGAVGG